MLSELTAADPLAMLFPAPAARSVATELLGPMVVFLPLAHDTSYNDRTIR
ncbi:hypothetical protein BLJAPNOD_06246 [Ensifer sp. M14]|nr:hypothetical protein BLJAPNOD_06246 [Ensifer sp. M14]